MAEIPTDDSVIQPTMVCIFNFLAFASIRLAGVKPPHFTNLTLTPWNISKQASTSVSIWQLSSAIIGKAECLKRYRFPSKSAAASGCSRNSTPSFLNSTACCSVSSSSQAPFASILKMASVCFLSAFMISRSSGVPNLILYIGQGVSFILRTIFSTLSMPMVKFVRMFLSML